jgi:hypothetical protein
MKVGGIAGGLGSYKHERCSVYTFCAEFWIIGGDIIKKSKEKVLHYTHSHTLLSLSLSIRFSLDRQALG